MHPHIIVLEDSSLELLPKKYWRHKSTKLVETRFDIRPENQILDDNFHHAIVSELPNSDKRGRPDVVHFALLDIMSTPAYRMGLVQPIIHTVNNEVIWVADNVRPPRTELRFNGVMSEVLKEKKENGLFQNKGISGLEDLLKLISPYRVDCLTTQGILKDFKELDLNSNEARKQCRVWIVGGFARGHFSEETKALADNLVSISNQSLAAHVVTARLCYGIEKSQVVRL